VINDDVELCARTPDAGLHLGQDDMPPDEARRRIGPERMLGLSTHSWEQARAAMELPAGVLSYFCVGPLFATPTKPDYTPVGLDLVRRVAGARPALPWFVIGGIKRTNLQSVLDAGAHRVVVVSDVLQAPDPAGVVREIRAAVRSR
jgi:thiamine-phosphate pyrophosphorylase